MKTRIISWLLTAALTGNLAAGAAMPVYAAETAQAEEQEIPAAEEAAEPVAEEAAVEEPALPEVSAEDPSVTEAEETEEETAAEETAAESIPADSTPAEDVPAEEPVTEEGPAEELPAEEAPAEEDGILCSIPPQERDYVPADSGADAEQLLTGYLEMEMGIPGSAGAAKDRRKAARYSYSAVEAAIVAKLKAFAAEVAAGTRTSTEISFDMSELGLEKSRWSAADLGLETVADGNRITEEAQEIMYARCDLWKVIGIFLLDCPYQLYWYDKTSHTSMMMPGLEMEQIDGEYYLYYSGTVSFRFPVVRNYAAGKYAVDPSVGQSVQAAAAKAQAIVRKYAAASDYEKLDGYRAEICSLVSYNYDVLNSAVEFGDPWQAIWVFDGDASTNVVCEGYAKAFKYLCDLSQFKKDVSCSIMTGEMEGGPHMWNVVNMGGGKNYLADITNCDAGTIGAPKELFLVGHADEYLDYALNVIGYYFNVNGLPIAYVYDEDAFEAYDAEELRISDSAYDPADPDDLPEPEVPEDAETEGTFGEIFRWEVSGPEGSVLTITGEGDLPDLSEETAPWETFRYRIRKLVIGGGVTRLDSSIPATIRHLQAVELGTDLAAFGEGAFRGCTELVSVKLPETITALPDEMFEGCASLTEIVIPDGVTVIGEGAFSGCMKLRDCELPSSLQELGDRAFYCCSEMLGFTFPKGFRKLGEEAVANMAAEYLVLPDTLESVEGTYLDIADDACIFYGGSEARFREIFSAMIEASEEYAGLFPTFFENYDVYYDLPDGPVRAESIELVVPEEIETGTPELVQVRVLPENATCTRPVFASSNLNVLGLAGDENGNLTVNGFMEGSGYITAHMYDGSFLTVRKRVKVVDAHKYDNYKYSIAFNGNGASSGKMKTLSKVPYRKNQTLTANAFKRTGYRFTGWNTAKDGSGKSYSNKAVVTRLTKTNGSTVTLYAQWEIIPYTITYKLGSSDAVNAEANPSSYDVTTPVTLQAPTRPFSTFRGWYSDAKLRNKVTTIKKGSTGNKTFYAKWTTNKYTITFKGNGATSGKMKDLTGIAYNADKTLTANAFKRKGYHFVEWNTAADGSGDSYANKQVVNGLSTENGVKVALYAIWEKDIYTINYVLNSADAVNAEANPATYDVEMSITLAAPTREHYVFSGWYSDRKLKKKASAIKKGSTGNKTFYAKWTPNKYTIAYNGNGSTGGKMKNTTGVAYGSSKKLTANAYSRKGYKFTGWNTEADGSGTAYANKASVRNLAEDNGVTVTLYAQWELETYKITYSLGSGAVNGEANPASYTVETETITLEAPTRTGYTFGGWYSDKKLKKKANTLAKGSTGNKTFYAKWTANKSTMTYSRDAIIEKARSYLGVTEGSARHREIIDRYNAKKPLPRGYAVKYTDAWCATYVSSIAIMCGYTDIIPTECGCPQMITLAKKMGIWQESDAYRPQKGDIILYDWEDSGSGDNTGVPDHIGFVESVSGNQMTIIEGNYNSKVQERKLSVNGRYIRGFITPKYTSEAAVKTAQFTICI